MKRFLYSFLLLILLVPNIVEARNVDIPPYDGTEGSYLFENPFLQLNTPFMVRSSELIGRSESGHTGDLVYPTFFNGRFGNIAVDMDTSEPYVRIKNANAVIPPYINVADRMVSEVERFTAEQISTKYNGNGEYVLNEMYEYNISNIDESSDYGQFYWIRDVAYLSGGYAGSGLVGSEIYEINPHAFYVVRTSLPEITSFTAPLSNSKMSPVYFKVEGYEYVSKGKFGDGEGHAENPYDDEEDRNKVRWELDIYSSSGMKIDSLEGSVRSTPKRNPQKPNEGDAGFISDGDMIRWMPQGCGNYTAKIKIIDSVKRVASEKTVTFSVDKDCDEMEPPIGGECVYNPNSMVTPSDLKPSSLVRTICDEYGCSYYYDHLDINIKNLSPRETKAGLGFSFEVETRYYNEYYSQSSGWYGPQRVVAYFIESDGQLPTKVEMVPTGNTRSWTNTWELPEVFLEKFNGDAAYNRSQLNNIDDEVISGGQKWYTPWKFPNGSYDFKVVAYDAGNNSLRNAQGDYVGICGSPFDDYVVRIVNPDNPFPAGIGANWQGYENIIPEAYQNLLSLINNSFE